MRQAKTPQVELDDQALTSDQKQAAVRYLFTYIVKPVFFRDVKATLNTLFCSSLKV